MSPSGSGPLRLQRRRTKGAHLPPGAICVTRPGPLGNPFVVGKDGTAAECVYLYARLLAGEFCTTSHATIDNQQRARAYLIRVADELRGYNLACYCGLCPKHAAGKLFTVKCEACAPCHSDIQGIFVNR